MNVTFGIINSVPQVRIFKHFTKYIHQAKSSLKFYFGAKTLYNIHSPLLFELLPFIFDHSDQDKKQYAVIERLVQKLKTNTETFEHHDLGMGSRKIKSKSKKSIKDVYYASSSYPRKGKILYKLVQYFKPKSTLELGTNLGVGTAYLASGNSANKLTTVEGDAFLGALSQTHFNSLGLDSIQVNIADFDSYLYDKKKAHNFDFVFIDGNHDYTPTVQYFNDLYDATKENQVIVFDDIYWSKGMTKAWEEVQSKLVSGYCIDLFQMGILINSKAINNVIKLKYIRKRWKPLSFGFWG